MDTWQTRFSTPTPEALLAAVPEVPRREIGVLADRFGPPIARWQGERWRWTLLFKVPSGEISVIPDPAQARLGVRLATGFVAEHPPESLPKPARDLLSHAVCVGPWTWTEWNLTSPGAAETVLGVLGLGAAG